MRAAVLREPGPAENLRLEDVDDPTSGPGEVVVRLRAAALNHRDVWIRSGTGAYAGGFPRRVILGLVYGVLLVLFIVFLPKGIVGSLMAAVRPGKAGRRVAA